MPNSGRGDYFGLICLKSWRVIEAYVLGSRLHQQIHPLPCQPFGEGARGGAPSSDVGRRQLSRLIWSSARLPLPLRTMPSVRRYRHVS